MQINAYAIFIVDKNKATFYALGNKNVAFNLELVTRLERATEDCF